MDANTGIVWEPGGDATAQPLAAAVESGAHPIKLVLMGRVVGDCSAMECGGFSNAVVSGFVGAEGYDGPEGAVIFDLRLGQVYAFDAEYDVVAKPLMDAIARCPDHR